MIWARYVARMREMRSTYKILVGKPEGKRPIGKQWRKCEDNTIYLKEMGVEIWTRFTVIRAGSKEGFL
jgi:homospermidine synthase